jgi:UDP-N-acetylglucosamine--N-acetylmuramyl-(pentapeptide) pyrophosphoryl-undecaprenol N-acetylglucosamine transferase
MQNLLKYKVILAGGGTGGHVFPAEALASEILARNLSDEAGIIKINIVRMICDNRTEKLCRYGALSSIPKMVLTFWRSSKSSFFAKLMNLFTFSFSNILNIFRVLFLFMRTRPSMVIAFGGYPTFSVLVVATVLRIPFILHEQNAVMGRVNRWFARYATMISLAAPETLGVPTGCSYKTEVTGILVRPKILEAAKQASFVNKNVIFIIGGSQGAKIFSNIIPEAIELLSPSLQQDLHVIHQARGELVDATIAAYAKLGISAEVRSFFDNIEEILVHRPIVITRAGASSIGDISSFGCPAILIPLGSAKDNHQYHNALCIDKNGGCVMIEEKYFNAVRLARELTLLLQDHTKQEDLSRNCLNPGLADVPSKFYEAIMTKLMTHH